jgi:ABC-type phosphate transport system substrate-binding protein
MRFLTVSSAVLILAIVFEIGRDPAHGKEERVPSVRGSARQSLAIVVNRSNPVDNLPFNELRKIFLGERGHWQNGHRIAVLMMEHGSPERETVLREIYRMTEARYIDHFLRGMFAEDVTVVPKTLDSPVRVRKFVVQAPGAIGYLRASDADESVKVLRIDGHLPSDKDYRLQIDADSEN